MSNELNSTHLCSMLIIYLQPIHCIKNNEQHSKQNVLNCVPQITSNSLTRYATLRTIHTYNSHHLFLKCYHYHPQHLQVPTLTPSHSSGFPSFCNNNNNVYSPSNNMSGFYKDYISLMICLVLQAVLVQPRVRGCTFLFVVGK